MPRPPWAPCAGSIQSRPARGQPCDLPPPSLPAAPRTATCHQVWSTLVWSNVIILVMLLYLQAHGMRMHVNSMYLIIWYPPAPWPPARIVSISSLSCIHQLLSGAAVTNSITLPFIIYIILQRIFAAKCQLAASDGLLSWRPLRARRYRLASLWAKSIIYQF